MKKREEKQKKDTEVQRKRGMNTWYFHCFICNSTMKPISTAGPFTVNFKALQALQEPLS